MFGCGISSEEICSSVPKCVDVNATFLVDSSNLKCADDVKCDDAGAWINNGVRKLYLNIENANDPKSLKVTIVKRGGKPPKEKHWFLTRTYFVYKACPDFLKMIVGLQGIVSSDLIIYAIFIIVLNFSDESRNHMKLQVIRYHFKNGVHSLPRIPHRNSKTSTPYKRQPPSTREMLRDVIKTSKPKEACSIVEKQLGGIHNEAGPSALPRNRQQAATLKRQLFPTSTYDPIMALVDMHKHNMSGFIRSLQILPSPICVLATDGQLHELVANCTNSSNFGIMHLDPTFNLGSFFVTPIVFPLVAYTHRKNKGNPSFIGPVLIHQNMHFGIYKYFLTQLVLLNPHVKHVKAIGTDGEQALCNAVKETFPASVHLRCLKHVRDSIEQKLRDLQFDKPGLQEIMHDIFGMISDGLKEIGLADAIDFDDFFRKLMPLEKKWNSIESSHRSFQLHQERKCVFYEWFCLNYSDIFTESIVCSARVKAGLGSPPLPFYNNRSESMNKLLKMHVKHQKSRLPEFVQKLLDFVNLQFADKKKADVSIGDWRKQQSTVQPQLSMSFEAVSQSLKIEIDPTILEALLSKAAELIHTEGQITRIPGDPFGRGRMVASTSSSHPHLVICGKKNDNIFNCDKHCQRYSAYGFCSHTFAVADVNGCLEKFIQQINKKKRKVNLSSLVYHGLPDGAGEKGGKAKPKRRRLTKDVDDLPVVDRLAHTPVQVTEQTHKSMNMLKPLPSPSSQPYYFKMLTPQIKVCAGCRLGYTNREPPYDVCVVHQESRNILNPQNKQYMQIPVNAHYHVTKSCIVITNPSFSVTQLSVPENLRSKLSLPLYRKLIKQEFDTCP